VQEGVGDGDEIGPLLREIAVKDFLKGDDELGADVGMCFRDDGDETLTDRSLFVVLDGGGGWLRIFGFGPALVDSVFEVDGGCGSGMSVDSVRGIEACAGKDMEGFHVLESRTPLSCSCSRIFKRASRKPGVSSAYSTCVESVQMAV
jgi:hypothetical protein